MLQDIEEALPAVSSTDYYLLPILVFFASGGFYARHKMAAQKNAKERLAISIATYNYLMFEDTRTFPIILWTLSLNGLGHKTYI
jgi:hypothetical protein